MSSETTEQGQLVVAFGSRSNQVLQLETAAGMLRKLHEKDPSLFGELLVDVMVGAGLVKKASRSHHTTSQNGA